MYSYRTIRKVFKNIPVSTLKKLHRYAFHDDSKWLKVFHKAIKQELKNTTPFSDIREY